MWHLLSKIYRKKKICFFPEWRVDFTVQISAVVTDAGRASLIGICAFWQILYIYILHMRKYTVSLQDEGQKFNVFCPRYLKTLFFYVVFNAELNGTIRIICFCRRGIIDLLWPRTAHLGHSMSIMGRGGKTSFPPSFDKHKILMEPFKSALNTT